MSVIKRIWNRIVVAFAQPTGKHNASGKTLEGTAPPNQEPVADYAANEKEQWKHHGGSRH